jgi:hypothetical protein
VTRNSEAGDFPVNSLPVETLHFGERTVRGLRRPRLPG